MPFMLSFSWCSPLQPHLLFKGMLTGAHTSSHLTLNTDLSPKSTPPSLTHLFPVTAMLLHFRVLQCPWIGSFLQLENDLVTQQTQREPLWASKSIKHSWGKQQRLEDTCRMGDTIPG